MTNFLLDAASSISQWSDLLTSKWAEILGWISIPTITTALICCVFKLITACINKKIAAKNVKPLADKVTEARDILLGTVNEIKTTFESNLNDYSELIENKVNTAISNYENSKKKAYDKIMESNLELKETIGDIELKIEDKKEVLAENINAAIEEVQQIEETIENAITAVKKIDVNDDNNDLMAR